MKKILLFSLIFSAGCGKKDDDNCGPPPPQDALIYGTLETEWATHCQGNVYAPEIMLESGIYRMWYGGQGWDGHDRIHYAESADGLAWNKFGVVLDSGFANHVNDPSVVKVAGTYYMYYTEAGVGTNDRIHYAESADGLAWNKFGVVLDNGFANHVNDPSVIKVGSVYFMYYTEADIGTNDRIHLATSPDGIVWSKQGKVLDVGPWAWNNRLVGRPAVLHENGIFKMWYDAISTDSNFPGRYVGYATSSNGFSWSKYASPVFQGGAVDVKNWNGTYVMLLESGAGTLRAESPDGVSWQDLGLWLPKDATPEEAFGHVTPFLFISASGPEFVYYGAAAWQSWDHNSIKRKPSQ